MITVGVIPLTFAMLASVFAIILINIKDISLLNKAKPVFTLIFLTLVLFMAMTASITSVELAEYEQNITDQTSLEDISTVSGIYTSIISIMLWPIIMFFAGMGIMYVFMNLKSWLFKK